MNYPPVLTEYRTLDLLLRGKYRGCVRYGDGCFSLMRMGPDAFHTASPQLAHDLAAGLADPAPGMLVCLVPPPVAKDGIAAMRWEVYSEANAGFWPLLPERVYGSSNISRMDSAKQCHTDAYWSRIAGLWAGRRVYLVHGSERSLRPLQLMQSPNPPAAVISVSAPVRNSYLAIDDIEKRIDATPDDVVLLCMGTGARVLSHRLVRRDLRCYDLGHLGMWFNDVGKPK